MQRPRLFLCLIAIALSSAANTTEAQQPAPRKYLIKPLNLSLNTEIRARSTRNLQVRVTDENDQPVPDAPVVFLLRGADTGGGNVGSLAGQTSLRVTTDAQGVAQVEYIAGDKAGSQAEIKAQVEGSDAVWVAMLLIISARADSPTSPKPPPSFSHLVMGQRPKSSVARQTYTTTDGEKISLDSKRGKVVVVFFFGVWCDASRRQIIAMKDLRKKDPAEEVQIIAMSVKDPRATPLLFQQLMTEQKVNYAVVPDVEDKHFVRFVNSKEVSVPQTLIYGQSGQLIGHYLGFNQQVGTEIERIVNDALARK